MDMPMTLVFGLSREKPALGLRGNAFKILIILIIKDSR